MSRGDLHVLNESLHRTKKNEEIMGGEFNSEEVQQQDCQCLQLYVGIIIFIKGHLQMRGCTR